MPRNRPASDQLGVPPHLTALLKRVGLGLLDAAYRGNLKQVKAFLSSGPPTGDPNLRGPGGFTALMLAVENGYEEIVKLLVDAGASASLATDEGFQPLHFCGQTGNVSIAKMLLKAGANHNAPTSDSDGYTPLHLAAENGQSGFVAVMIEAGADPLLTSTDEQGQTFLPLETAAFRGYSGVVRELVRQPGIGACGGPSRGVDALRYAAQEGHLDIMAILMDGGVVDTGYALVDAAGYCGEAAVKLLLRRRRRQRQRQLSSDATRGDAYVNAKDRTGRTAVISGILLCRPGSRRVVRMLVDAGADTSSAVRLTMPGAGPFFRGTPLDFLKVYVGQKKEDDATEKTLNILEAIRRLLLRVEAVHAVSWLWHTSGDAEGKPRTRVASSSSATSPLIRMLPILRRRANRRRVILASFRRYASKP